MTRRLLSIATVLLVAAAPAAHAVPDPERSTTTGVNSEAGSPYVGTDANTMMSALAKAGMRITTVAVNVHKGKRRYYVGYVANRGVQRRAWWWDPAVSEKRLWERLKQRNARLIDLEVYEYKGKRVLSAVSVANTGVAAKTWWWHPRVKRSTIFKIAEEHESRVVDMERDAEGRIDLITIANTGEDARAWSIVSARGVSLKSFGNYHDAMQIQDIEWQGGKLDDLDVVLVAKERDGGWFATTAEKATDAAAATRNFAGRTSVVEILPSNNPKYPKLPPTIVHVGVSDVTVATEAARKELVGARWAETKGSFGMLVWRFGEPGPLVSQNPNLKHETASSLKVLHHAAITRHYEQRNLPIDKAADLSYKQYIGIPSCPTAASDGKPVVQRTLREAATDMLRASDNGATAAVLARVGGKSALTRFARSLGLPSVSLGSALGCWERDDPNLWTLNDAGRLYGRIAAGQVVTREPYRTHLIDSLADGSVEFQEAWRTAAEAAGRPDLAAHAKDVAFRSKAGGYGGGQGTIATIGGVLWLPVSIGGRVERRAYFIGSFFDSPGSLPSTYRNPGTVLGRAAIRDALASFG